MDRDLYRKQFHLNESEIELISGLIPKQQFLLKTPELAKVANLNVDRKSYWRYTNDPYDNKKRYEAFAKYGFERGLEVLKLLKQREWRLRWAGKVGTGFTLPGHQQAAQASNGKSGKILQF